MKGKAWIDHQVMMRSLDNPPPTPADSASAQPIPYLGDPKPFDAWSWQYFNRDNGDAFTCAAFQTGPINPYERGRDAFHRFTDFPY